MDIIFCNKGNCEVFRNALETIADFSPDTTVHLITDTPVNQPWICEYPIAKYSQAEEVKAFRSSYKHLSTNPADFEMACLERWIIIPQLAEELKLKECIVSDWDVLYFCNLNDEAEKLRNKADFTVINKISTGTSFWFNIDALNAYKNLILDVYLGKNREARDRIFQHFYALQREGKQGGVCDMTFAEYLIATGKYKVHDTYTVAEDNSIFDANITLTRGWKANGGVKRFTWRDGIPYCYNTHLNRDVKFKCIHCTSLGKGMSHELIMESRRTRCQNR